MTAVRNFAGTALASYNFDDRSRRTALTYANGASAAYSIVIPAEAGIRHRQPAVVY